MLQIPYLQQFLDLCAAWVLTYRAAILSAPVKTHCTPASSQGPLSFRLSLQIPRTVLGFLALALTGGQCVTTWASALTQSQAAAPTCCVRFSQPR